jgi:acyl carrier protein
MTDPALIVDLANIVRAVALVPPEVPISTESRFVDDLAVDSFDMVGIIFAVQDKFGVKVNEEDMPNLTSMAELAAYVVSQRAQEAA